MKPSNPIEKRILERIDQLPPMPHSVAEVMKMSKGEEYSAADLANVVCRDPTLAGRVLNLCNSGFYGLGREVTSVQRAVLLLGFDMIKNLVLSTFVHSAIEEDPVAFAQTTESLWQHCFGAATAAMMIAVETDPENIDSAYTAGLVHDIGKVAIHTVALEGCEAVLELVQARGMSYDAAERQVLGTTHAEVGALVAEHWHLAPELLEVVRHHHDPGKAGAFHSLVATVNLADTVCGILGIGPGLDNTDCEIDARSLEVLGLDEARFEKLLGGVTRRLLSLQDASRLMAV